jgi:hypothetical protein
MERGAISARGAKRAERKAQIDASVFFTPGGVQQNAAPRVFRGAGLRLPVFCPAWNGSRATADRASGDELAGFPSAPS